MKQLLILAILFFVVRCTTPKNQKEPSKTADKKVGVTYKLDNNDSIVLNNGTAPFFYGLQIFRNQKSILRYTDKDLQINSTDRFGNDSNWLTVHSPGTFS